jgi:hypothetical protein
VISVWSAPPNGTGAQRQRQAYQRAGRFDDVVRLIASQTAATA